MSSDPTTSKKRKSQTLTDMFNEARKKRRLAGEVSEVRKQSVPVGNKKGLALASSASTNKLIPQPAPSNSTTKAASTTKKSLTLKGRHCAGEPKSGLQVQTQTAPVANNNAKKVAPSNSNTKEPTLKIPRTPPTAAPSVAKKPLSLKERMLKRAREDRIARDAEKAKNAAGKPYATGQPTKEKRKVAWDDDSGEDQPDAKKPRKLSQASRPRPAIDHKAGTTASAGSARQAEPPLRFTSSREQRHFHREQLVALDAIKSARSPPGPKQPTASLPKQDRPRNQVTNHSSRRVDKPAGGRIAKSETSSSKQEPTNGQGKHHIAQDPNRAVNNRLGSHAQVKSKSTSRPLSQNQAPHRRTDPDTGKSPAIENDSGPKIDLDSDSDAEVEQKLSPREKKQQELEKRRKALDAYKGQRLARQASRATRSQSLSPRTSTFPTESSSQPTPAQSTESTPASPVTESIAATAHSRSSSRELLDSSGSSRTASLSEIRRKFFKD